MKKIISTKLAPAAVGPYSQAVQVGPFLFCSGQIAIDPSNNQVLVTASVKEQTEQVMKNIGAVLHEAGLQYSDVVKTTIFLTSMDDFQTVNEVYSQFFAENPPARSTVAVLALPKGVKVEVEVLAHRS